MEFPEHEGFTLISDLSRVRKPQGAQKRKSRRRATRRPVYLPTSNEAQEEAALWLIARKT